MNKTSLSEAETLLFVGTYSEETGCSSSKSKHAPLLPYLVRVDAALLSHTREFLKSLLCTVAFFYSESRALLARGVRAISYE